MGKPVVFRVTNNLNIGGVQRRLRSVLPRLVGDFDVHVVTYKDRGRFWHELPELGVTTHFTRLGGKWNPAGIGRMARIMREHGAQVVHTHSLGANIAGILAAARAGAPVRIGQVHHRGVHWYAGSRLGRWKQARQEALVHRRFTDRVLFVSRESLRYFRDKTGLPDEKLELLHNGLDFDAMQPARPAEEVRREFGVPRDATLVGFVGRLAPGKGVGFCMDFALRALRERDDLFFLLVGGSDQATMERWRTMAAGAGGRIAFAGERGDVYDLFNAFDCFLFPSRAEWEGMPGVVLEACAFGLPVISRYNDPVLEISAYYPRIAFMAEDEEPAAVLERAMALPEAAPGPLREEFSLEAMVKRTRRLYMDLLREKGAAP
jgi:glycosyltransferase involved in cell wall biosynthesis